MTIFEEILEFVKLNTDIPTNDKDLKIWAKSSEVNTGVFAVCMLCKQYNAITSPNYQKGSKVK